MDWTNESAVRWWTKWIAVELEDDWERDETKLKYW